MNVSQNLRKFARIAGAVLFAASLYFIYQAVLTLDPGQSLAPLGLGGLLTIVFCSLAYGGSLTLLAIAWHAVATAADPNAPRSPTVIAYGRSVLAKYLPGSVFQYASRQVLGAAAGFEQKRMALSSALEIAIHILVAAMLSASLLAISGLWVAPALAVLGGCGVTLAILAARKVPGFGSAMALQIAFFAAFAVIAGVIAWLVVGAPSLALALAGVFLAAWLAGFLVPFAPGGIGVREAALIAFGAGIAEPAALLSFAALTRLVTLGGDFWFGMASYLAPGALARWNKQASVGQ